ncbi:MAG: hypothetical protein RSB20_00275, partial [Clostridia bacterium]
MCKRNKKVYNDDDGRMVAPMNVPGMPWYNKDAPSSHEEAQKNRKTISTEPISKKDTFKTIMAVYLAVIPIALAFILGFALLI